MKKVLFKVSGFVLVAISGIILYAYSNTWGKTDLQIRIHINDKLVKESNFGESPTFAIWLEDPETGNTRTIYVTRRAAEGDWEGKAEVPVALPKWFNVQKLETKTESKPGNVDAYSGATPKPGYFTAKTNLVPGSKWICWIEVNLAGDFNDYYQGNKTESNDADKYLSGQPALLYRAEITALIGSIAKPSVLGMTMLDSDDTKIVRPLEGITTATGIFDEIGITIVKPKPKIFRKGFTPLYLH
ncbi:MAG: hypothetical protein WCS03_14985 [Bacteroidota bacterium]